MDLQRFVTAQNEVFPQVRAELVSGEKRGHWMWFIFPQLAVLGTRSMAERYAIEGLGEARRYLAHPVLGPRLGEVTQLMLGWAGRRSAVAILGPVDAVKFCSSMSLFELAALERSSEADRFGHALDAFCQGRRDERTIEMLNRVSARPAA